MSYQSTVFQRSTNFTNIKESGKWYEKITQPSPNLPDEVSINDHRNTYRFTPHEQPVEVGVGTIFYKFGLVGSDYKDEQVSVYKIVGETAKTWRVNILKQEDMGDLDIGNYGENEYHKYFPTWSYTIVKCGNQFDKVNVNGKRKHISLRKITKYGESIKQSQIIPEEEFLNKYPNNYFTVRELDMMR